MLPGIVFCKEREKKSNLYASDAVDRKVFRPAPDNVVLQTDFNTIDLEGHAIGISANDPTVGNAFQQSGVKGFSWDSDVLPSTRAVFVNQVSEDVVGSSLLQILAKEMNYTGGWAILSATPAGPAK